MTEKTEQKNQVKVAISPSWKVANTKNVVLYVQATQTSGYEQKVTVKGPGIPEGGVSGQSTKGDAFGSQLLNAHYSMNYTDQYPNWIYEVTISYKDDNGVWQESTVEAHKEVEMGTQMSAAFVLSNDAGSDKDYNDCLVLISCFRDSND